MIVGRLVRGWNDFWFRPERPTPIAAYRIAYGVLTIANLLLLHGDWLTWYGPHATLRLATLREIGPGPRIALLSIWPQSDAAIGAFFWLFLAAAVCLTIGWMTRLSSIAVFLCLVSIQDRNPYILNSGDTMMRVAGFFLMFAPAGAALSVDRLRRIWRGREGLAIEPRPPWAQRMIQLEVSVMYISAVLSKLGGRTWWNGTALYFVFKVRQFQRFPVPWADNLAVLRVATWGTLLIEGAAGVLIWVRRVRYPVLLAALALHMGIEYAMNIPLFEWEVVATFLTFIDPDDLSRAWAWVRARAAPYLAAPVTVVYDGAVDRAARCARVLQAADVLHRLCVAEAGSREAGGVGSDGLTVVTARGERYTGRAALGALARRVPLLWPLAPLGAWARPSDRGLAAPTAIG